MYQAEGGREAEGGAAASQAEEGREDGEDAAEAEGGERAEAEGAAAEKKAGAEESGKLSGYNDDDARQQDSSQLSTPRSSDLSWYDWNGRRGSWAQSNVALLQFTLADGKNRQIRRICRRSGLLHALIGSFDQHHRPVARSN